MSASIFAKLLGWTGLPQWAIELILVALVAAGVWFWHHETFKAGIAQQVASDNAATLKLKSDVAVETAKLNAKVDLAEHSHDDELQDLRDYRASNPVSVGVCPPHGGGAGVSITAKSGDATSSAGIAVQQVPAGDSQKPRDIGPLLEALAASADSVSADLREYQATK